MVLTLVAATTVVAAGSGGAAAQPPTPSDVVSSTTLPSDFPADLKKYIGGTEEFRAAEWFQGACASRGGDMGAYLAGMLTNENRLMWWSMPDTARVQLLMASQGLAAQNSTGTEQLRAQAEQLVREGKEPPESVMPKVFPAGDAEYHPPKDVCADDLKSWATASSNTWGFEWAKQPDSSSLQAMRSTSGGGKVPEKAWTEPCSAEELGIYCAHAFFVDCAKADNNTATDPKAAPASTCRAWNARVGHLFAGTANWIDQNTGFGDRVARALGGAVAVANQWHMGRWVVSALSGLAAASTATLKFIENPLGAPDEWANAMKEGSIDLTTKVLKSLAGASHFDPSSEWFRNLYAVSMGLGLILMAVLAVGTIQRSSRKGSPRELAEALFGWLPLSLFFATFAPGFAALLLEVTTSMTEDMAQLGGQPTGELLANIASFNNATSANFPGGSLMAIVMFGLMLVGALMVWVGLMVHDFGLPLAGMVSAISLFMLVHPKYRHKALRPVYVFVGLAFSVPMLFLLLAGIFTTTNQVFGEDRAGLGQVAQVFTVALAMVMVGLAPWALLKWAPILPTAADSEDIGQGSSTVGDVLGSTGNAMIFARGGGVGGERPNPRADGSPPAENPASVGTPGGGNGTSGGSSGTTGEGATNPLTRTYKEKSAESGSGAAVGGPGAHPGVHSGGDGAAAAGTRAAETGGKAAAGAATGGAVLAAAVGTQAVSSAVNKAKSISDDAAPRVDDDR
ncbi:hypothetical protein [Nocardia otitidiscaviarum]|uniref:hypothetical protein n=1 Tax=Nocardia otitidiscaviarum TaxID=1823 RepID=UPI0011C06C6E|nr:hypothetical protein [Nocardia otitidiscaviarum]